FRTPVGLAFDSSGNLLVADLNNQTIRRISTQGDVTTLAGLAGSSGSADGTGTAARFRDPSAIAVDPSHNRYLGSGNTIRRITPSGSVTTIAGAFSAFGSTDGPAADARFGIIVGLAFASDGVLYIADNNKLRTLSGGTVTTVSGSDGPTGYIDGP